MEAKVSLNLNALVVFFSTKSFSLFKVFFRDSQNRFFPKSKEGLGFTSDSFENILAAFSSHALAQRSPGLIAGSSSAG